MLEKSLNMIQKPKCVCCIPLETGCFIFGVFSSVLSGIGIIGISFTLAHLASVMRAIAEEGSASNRFDSQAAMSVLSAYGVVMLLYICAITSFIFAVFLCYGVHKRRAGFVKAYLVFGIVVTVLMMIAATLYSVMMEDLVGGSLILIICGIYSLILLMVQKTYETFRSEAMRERSQLLDSKPCMKA